MATSSLIFAYPAWFWAAPALLLLGLALWKVSAVLTQRRLSRFFSAALLPQVRASVSRGKKATRFGVTFLILLMLAMALARPLTGPRSDSDERHGADLVIALDVSKSMWTEDVAPNRLEAVKKELSEWIFSQKRDRIGLVLFAGKAFVQAPLTYDYTALDFVLREAGPKSISKPGTNIPEAIETAVQMMKNNKLESKTLVIISDGENLEEDAIAAARKAHQDDGLTIYTVGVGTGAGGKVPAYDRQKFAPDSPEARQARNPYVRNEYGADVVSRLDSQALRAIASVGGGAYYEFRPGESTFPNLRNKSISTLVEKSRKIKTRDYDEWFQIPLGLAILLMVMEPLLGRPRRPAARRETGVPVIKPVSFSKPRPVPVRATPVARVAKATAKASAIFLALALTLSSARAEIFAPDEHAEKLFAAGKGSEAVDYLARQVAANPTDPYLSYNYGLALYRTNRLDEANTIFQSIEGLTADPKLRAMTLFQMGNIASKTGWALSQPGQNQNNVGAIRAYEQALGNYQAQLQIRSDRDGRQNLSEASDKLVEILLAVGAERTRANTEKTLREALQAFERAAELDPKKQPFVDKAKELLSRELIKNATTEDQAADKAEAAQTVITDKTFKDLMAKREEITSKLDEARGLQPDNKELQEALKKQQEKTSDLLTRAARDQAADALKTERFFSNRSLKNLEEAGDKLNQALALNPQNKPAEELDGQVKKKLEDAYVANGDLALGHLKKMLGAEDAAANAANPSGTPTKADKKPDKEQSKSTLDQQLENGISASEAYSKALALNPNNEEAQKGLAETNALLPDLYAKVGKADLDKAGAQVGNNLPAPSASPGPDSKGANSGPQGANSQTPDAGKSPDGKNTASGNAPDAGKPSANALRSASATLEKALQNLGAANSLKPSEENKKNLSDAESLMDKVRSELDKINATAAAAPGGAPGAGKDGGSGDGPGGSGEGKGPGKEGGGQSSLKSMSALRGKGGESGGGEGGDSKRYWEKFVRDW